MLQLQLFMIITDIRFWMEAAINRYTYYYEFRLSRRYDINSVVPGKSNMFYCFLEEIFYGYISETILNWLHWHISAAICVKKTISFARPSKFNKLKITYFAVARIVQSTSFNKLSVEEKMIYPTSSQIGSPNFDIAVFC